MMLTVVAIVLFSFVGFVLVRIFSRPTWMPRDKYGRRIPFVGRWRVRW